MVENIHNHPYAFSIRPFKDGPIYIVEAYSTLQRVFSFFPTQL